MEAVAPALASTELSQSEIDAWNEKGYHIHGKLFSDEEVAALRGHCELVSQGIYETGVRPDGVGWRPGGDPLQVRKFDNCWKADRTIAEFVLSSKLGHIAAQLLGAKTIRMWHDQYLHKPANGGKTVTWHQDWAYWQALDRCETVTCWIALDDVRADSGPMVFLEGSHKYGLFPLPGRISGDDSAFPTLPPEMKSRCREVPVIIPAGCVSFHHGLTLHGSERNTSPIPRRAMVSHIMSGDCVYREGQHHHNLDWMKTYTEYPRPGERFFGPQYPIMWPIEKNPEARIQKPESL